MQLKKKYEFPKHVSFRDETIFLENHLYLSNRKIHLKDITSLRSYASDIKTTVNFIPSYRTIEQDMSIRQKGGDVVTIYMKKLQKSFHINPMKEGSVNEKKFDDTQNFINYIEEQSIDYRLNQYSKTETDEIYFSYNSIGNSFLSEFNLESQGSNYLFFKDGSIKKNGEEYLSFDLDKYKIAREYKTLKFEKRKKSLFGNNNYEIDISWDFDLIIHLLSRCYNIKIP